VAVFKSLPVFPLLYIAPRGLITILLFFGIPDEAQSDNFDNSIVLFVVITTSLIMTISLIQNGIGIKSADPEHDIMMQNTGIIESEEQFLEDHSPEGNASPQEDPSQDQK
jgi:NhaP-type Na+/H+ or K+/H+ antiporter